MRNETCAGCRFWLPMPDASDCPIEGPGFGWCRRDPPKIIDHMARIAIRTPGFGGNVRDPEDVASVSTVHCATLHPATYRTDWCGHFDATRLPTANADEQARWAAARRAYEAARAAELASADDEEGAHLLDVRDAAEDTLMAIPSPDPAAFAFKYLVARGDGRETDCWDSMLEGEAKRLVGEGR